MPIFNLQFPWSFFQSKHRKITARYLIDESSLSRNFIASLSTKWCTNAIFLLFYCLCSIMKLHKLSYSLCIIKPLKFFFKRDQKASISWIFYFISVSHVFLMVEWEAKRFYDRNYKSQKTFSLRKTSELCANKKFARFSCVSNVTKYALIHWKSWHFWIEINCK